MGRGRDAFLVGLPIPPPIPIALVHPAVSELRAPGEVLGLPDEEQLHA